MENDNFKKGIDNIKNIKLSDAEKDTMFKNLSEYANFPQKTPTKTFYEMNYYSWFAFMRKGGMVAMALVLVFGGTVFASSDSLPGDLLYRMKVNIEEPMRNVVNFSQASKIDWEAKKADKRLEEIEILSERGTLDPKTRVEVETLFEEHTKKFNSLVEGNSGMVEKQETIDKKVKARMDFEENVSKRTEKLDKIKEKLSNNNEKQEVENFKNSVLETIRRTKNNNQDINNVEIIDVR